MQTAIICLWFLSGVTGSYILWRDWRHFDRQLNQQYPSVAKPVQKCPTPAQIILYGCIALIGVGTLLFSLCIACFSERGEWRAVRLVKWWNTPIC